METMNRKIGNKATAASLYLPFPCNLGNAGRMAGHARNGSFDSVCFRLPDQKAEKEDRTGLTESR